MPTRNVAIEIETHDKLVLFCEKYDKTIWKVATKLLDSILSNTDKALEILEPKENKEK